MAEGRRSLGDDPRSPPGRAASPGAGEGASIRFRPNPAQRALMRQIFAALGDDREAVCRAYVEAEGAGKVERPRGAEDMTPHAHAGTLWQEGKLKRWLGS